MKAELVPENGDPPIPITRDLVVVGRCAYCDVVIDDSSLSRRHCVLVKTDGLLVIRDLISTNGTKVKGQKVRWAALLPDDRITLGSYKLRVYLGSDDVPGPSELAREKSRSMAPAPPACPPQAVKDSPGCLPARDTGLRDRAGSADCPVCLHAAIPRALPAGRARDTVRPRAGRRPA